MLQAQTARQIVIKCCRIVICCINNMQPRISESLSPTQVTSQQMVYTNCVWLSPSSALPPNMSYLTVKGFVLAYKHSPEIPDGKIGLSRKQREFLSVSKIDQLLVAAYQKASTDKEAIAVTMRVEAIVNTQGKVQIDDESLIKRWLEGHSGQTYLNINQVFVMEAKSDTSNLPVVLTVQKLSGDQGCRVYLGSGTKVTTVAYGEQQIRLKSTKNQMKNVFSADFTLGSLGIGGLDNELSTLFRRAFASRRLPHAIVEKFGIKHVKGILLYGPPGTGKTLIARQLSKALKAKSLQIVNGPEVFGKYVGESEENIRKLFENPRADEKKFGEESPLHVIVFDEIDAICRQRGSDSSSAGK